MFFCVMVSELWSQEEMQERLRKTKVGYVSPSKGEAPHGTQAPSRSTKFWSAGRSEEQGELY